MNIITFELDGNDPEQLKSAIANVYRSWTWYPDWECLFYITEPYDPTSVGMLQLLGCQTVICGATPFSLEQKMKIEADLGVVAFIRRKLEPLITQQESDAVKRLVFENYLDQSLLTPNCPVISQGVIGKAHKS